jgi:hypothetical protein
MLREIADELAALGWRAVLHGPEIHLVLPVVYAAIGAVTILIINGRKK